MKWLKNRKYIIDVQGHIHVLNNVAYFVHVCKVASVRVSLSHHFPLMKILSRVCHSDVPFSNNMHSNLLAMRAEHAPGAVENCHLVNTKEVETLFGLNKTKWNHLNLSHPRTLPCMLAGSTRVTHFNCTRSKICARVQLRSW